MPDERIPHNPSEDRPAQVARDVKSPNEAGGPEPASAHSGRPATGEKGPAKGPTARTEVTEHEALAMEHDALAKAHAALAMEYTQIAAAYDDLLKRGSSAPPKPGPAATPTNAPGPPANAGAPAGTPGVAGHPKPVTAKTLAAQGAQTAAPPAQRAVQRSTPVDDAQAAKHDAPPARPSEEARKALHEVTDADGPGSPGGLAQRGRAREVP